MGRLFLGMALLIASAAAPALEFRSVAVNAAVLYDAPSNQAKKLFILSRYYPVEIIVALDKWMKVRDASGALAWVESAKLGTQRTVLVTAAEAEVHAQPDAAAPVVFKAQRDVALDVVEITGAWVKVKHRDGQIGFISDKDVWGI